MTAKIKLAAVFFALLALSSCAPGKGKPSLPPTPILGSSSRWVVVESAYLLLKEEPEALAPDAATARRAEILEMTARLRVPGTGGEEELWYGLAKEGKTLWAPALGLELHDSLEKARTAAGALR